MTPDELPADMEAVVARLEVAASDPAPWPDLRDLLKAYQEQRRALEGINQLARDRLALIPADLVCGGVVGDLLVDILGRAALTGEDA